MRLERLTPPNSTHAYQADSDRYSVCEYGDKEPTADVLSLKFGASSERFSDFEVSLKWSDVEALIRVFSDKGHLEAVRLERARKLATAVEEIAKNSN
jgi:hypothetical protein